MLPDTTPVSENCRDDVPLLYDNRAYDDYYAIKRVSKLWTGFRYLFRQYFCFWRSQKPEARDIRFDGVTMPQEFVDNALCNTRYNIITFLPLVLFEQFRYFFNLFYLLVAAAQFIPQLETGPKFTYLAPLSFVFFVSMSKEAFDDYKRWLRDKEANNQKYKKLNPSGKVNITASKIKVGDIIQVEANQRVPADLLFIKASGELGSCFIRTDQLDGETDWKLRRAIQCTQSVTDEHSILTLKAVVHAEKPRKDIYEFSGRLIRLVLSRNGSCTSIGSSGDASFECQETKTVEGLTLDNTLWANTVVASGSVLGLVIYTGKETRASMNASGARTKLGLFDSELNFISKILFFFLVTVAFILSAAKGMEGLWWIRFLRFILLLCSIIPISLRVNLDMAKTLYGIRIMQDKAIFNTVVRTSTIPEELGRIDYLLTDKTGTLTQNDMVFKKLHIGRAQYGPDDTAELRMLLFRNIFGEEISKTVKKREDGSRLLTEALLAISVCHMVTPVEDGEKVDFQAASPDEVALVKFVRDLGITLLERNDRTIRLSIADSVEEYHVLECFPFSSDSKRMGVILHHVKTDSINFYLKGAESVIIPKLLPKGASWLQEECDNFARQGLRTLVFCHKKLTLDQYESFAQVYRQSKASMMNRSAKVSSVLERLEKDMTLLCLTGVEDRLQEDVQGTLEALRHGGVKTWMLTGDKIETATCVAISAGLKSRLHSLTVFSERNLPSADAIEAALQDFSIGPLHTVLVIDGFCLAFCMSQFPHYFIEVTRNAPAVICCRCSPTQKAEVVTALKKYTNLRTCAIGDGGNDVSMIQAADIGVGIVGKEGKQASLAADFSVLQFRYLRRLLLWHGRNGYQRSAQLAQFVIHRGLIIATIQVFFSALFFFVPIAIFQGWLQVGYSTFYTTAPVFSMVLDVDLPEQIVLMFPELYLSLRSGRSMSVKTFFGWVWRSIYQGAVIMMGAIIIFERSLTNIVSVAFTSLILAELLNVATEIQTWHPLMIASQICTAIVYFFSMFILRTYFDIRFIMTWSFWWKVLVITVCSWLPIHLFKIIRKVVQPPQYTKLTALSNI